ncbi:unnamed protein product, partial [Rotaria sp. Silwood2]
MPELGLCTDITCDDEMKELFECYCCLRLVCLTHLITHLETKKQKKQQLDDICNQLNTVKNKLKLIVEEKLLPIKHEQNLIEQAEKFLDVPGSSFDEIRNLFENINQTIASNHSEEIMIKVEPLLSETKYCSSICTCNKENIYFKDDENLNDIKPNFIALDATTTTTENQHVNEKQKKRQQASYKKFVGKCPFTFDGAYGLTEANHSITLCQHRRHHQIHLYKHLIRAHRLKEVYVLRLIQAVANNQDPRITKLFDEKENVISHNYKVPCPFSYEQINSSKYTEDNLVIPSCGCRFVPFYTLRGHLRQHHKISNKLIRQIFDDLKES